jgi:enamine deaminase RidA (YjgF/YER057c/UK114 family)
MLPEATLPEMTHRWRRGADGSPLGPFGKVPSQVSLEDAQASARAAVLAMLASLKRAVGELDNIAAWLMVYGNINADPGYAQTTLVANPASELLVDLYGPDAGAHARTAIGMAALPLDLPVILAAEVELAA